MGLCKSRKAAGKLGTYSEEPEVQKNKKQKS
jgi:hypothetical protein